MKHPVIRTRSQKIFDTLLNHDEFKREYVISRKRFLETAKESVHKDGRKYLSQWNDKVLQEETSRIMNTFASLPDSWEDSVREYIKTGELKPPTSSTKPRVTLQKVLPSHISTLVVQVFKHTTRKEYLDAWKEVERLKQEIWELDPKPLSKKEIAIIKASMENKKDWEILRDLPYKTTLYGIRKTISRKGRQLGMTVKRKKRSHKG